MIARGDLLVEIGYERLAEVQEEILWLCEAAHVPVIWATLGPRGSGAEGPAFARRDHRRRHGSPRGMRHAEQGTAHHRSRSFWNSAAAGRAWPSSRYARPRIESAARPGLAVDGFSGRLLGLGHRTRTRGPNSLTCCELLVGSSPTRLTTQHVSRLLMSRSQAALLGRAVHRSLWPRMPSGSAMPTLWRDISPSRERLASIRAAASA